MAAPGRFLYKALPTASRAGVITVPITWPVPQTETDAKDGFIHLSGAEQLRGTLNRFFPDEDNVTLIKLLRDRVEKFKVLKWEGGFPHLYSAELEQSDLDRDGVRQIIHAKGTPWDDALSSLGGWLEP